jgi:uncharacterized membrane protein
MNKMKAEIIVAIIFFALMILFGKSSKTTKTKKE